MALSASDRDLYTRIDEGLSKTEECLKWPGYIPAVSMISGALRQLIGLVMMAVAFIFVIFNSIRQIFILDQERNRELLAETYQILHYAKHGLFNIFRGQIEAIPLIQWTCLLYDYAAQWRVTYPLEPRNN